MLKPMLFRQVFGRVLNYRWAFLTVVSWVSFCAFTGPVGFVGGYRCQQNQPPAADPCENAQSTAEMLDCWDSQYKTADAELNRIYKEIMSRLRDTEKAKLRDAQRAWIPYKEKKGEAAAAQYEGGTFAGVAKLIALTEETQNRVAELKKTYRDLLPDEVLQTPQPEVKTTPPTPPPPQPPSKTLGRLPPEQKRPEPTLLPLSQAILGTWQFEPSGSPADAFTTMKVTFNGDNTCKREFIIDGSKVPPDMAKLGKESGDSITPGKWKVYEKADNVLLVTYDDPEHPDIWKISSLNGDKLIMKARIWAGDTAGYVDGLSDGRSFVLTRIRRP